MDKLGGIIGLGWGGKGRFVEEGGGCLLELEDAGGEGARPEG